MKVDSRKAKGERWKEKMSIWQGLGIFFFGCLVGAFVGVLVIALCQVAASADRRIERMALERYEREKAEAESTS